MSDEPRRDAPVCECGRKCVRGSYGYFEPTCGAVECKPADRKERLFTVFNGTKRNRNRLGTTSTKALEEDFEPGLPDGGSK